MAKKIGLFYSFNSNKTKKVVAKLKNSLLEFDIQDINIEDANENSLDPFENLLFGSSTWFDGELPNYWDEFLPSVENKDFSGKKLAIFGLGDQKNYSENFCDAIGILADFFEKRGIKLIGRFPLNDFTFEGSKAVRNNEFLGLPIDEENLSNRTAKNIEKWSEILKSEFKLKLS
jgi:flavodoxin I